MSDEFNLIAEMRDDRGKGASRRLRHQGKVPAIIYGAGREPRALMFDHNKVLRELENASFYSSILTIKVGDKSRAAIVKDIQRHPSKKQILHIDFQRIVEDEKIKIDLSSSLPTTASALFNESKKQKAAIGSIEKLLKKTENELEKVVKKGESAKQISVTQVRKKNWFERYRWFYTTDGVLAIGGRDSSSNSAIIRKHLQKNDKVFHAEMSGSPFFLLKGDDAATPASLTEVAHATVCFSKVWKEAFYGSSAYWVNPDQVKKGAPSGQSMAKGSFMIEGQRNFVKISSMKMCVAIIKHEESYLLTCGPPSMKDTAVCYAMIEPTGQDMPDVAKRIRYEFLSSNEEIAKPFSIDDFVRVLPTGACNITESGSGT